jgi:DNA segregation ATPase FtsK/SpoIIIE, S-DNA-T family
VSDTMAVSELGDLVNGLRATAARLNENISRLEKETATRRGTLLKQAEAELQKLREEQNGRRESISTSARERTEHLETRTAERKNCITKAHATSRKRAMDRIDEVEGRRKFAVQKGLLDTEKSRDQRLAELEREWVEAQRNAEQFRYRTTQLHESARKSFRAYPTFPRLLRRPVEAAGSEKAVPEAYIRGAEQSLKRYRARILPELFRFLPIWLWWLVGLGLLFAGPERLGFQGMGEPQFRQLIFGVLGGVTFLYFLGWWLGGSAAKATATNLRHAEHAVEEGFRTAEKRYSEETERTRSEAHERIAVYQEEWEAAIGEAAEARRLTEREMGDKLQRALSRNEQLYLRGRTQSEEMLKAGNSARDGEDEAASVRLKENWKTRIEQLQSDYDKQKRAAQEEWDAISKPALKRVNEANAFAQANFSPWKSDTTFRSTDSALNVIKFGAAKVSFPAPLGPKGEGAIEISAPLMLVLPDEGSIVIESDEGGRGAAIDALNNILYRAIQTIPPGKVTFTLIDPVRLGQSFSSVMHLADFEENVVNRRIWTEPAEIEERLLELNSHMEKVIQMYLRNEFRDIVDYNREAGRIAEKYHFLVLADFPANFTDTAMRRLMKIAASGARCGVYTLIHWDKRHAFLPGFEAKDFLQNAVHLLALRSGVAVPRFAGKEVTVELDRPPEPELATRFLQEVGEASRGSNTVQVPFSQIAPEPEKRWSLETTEELRVAIGRSGATKLQYFSLGKGTRQHVLIAGKTGSGKSTLFHVLVTNLALWSSPEQVEFYLVDFKKGVEFKDYAVAKLPHARVVAIESDREFGLSVLRRVDEELRVRGELFRAVGAQDLAGYKRASRNGRMPRVLLIIDEFQELFVEDDAISQNAALLLDRIVRQGRAFGIHVVLGSQTLGGAYSLARSTLGQMVVRIALQTNEADAYLIMDENNPAPRLLSRPGEGIYNDAGGAIEANSPFQVVWLPEAERREALQAIQNLAQSRGERSEPIVFEGNTLADIAANAELHGQLDAVAKEGQTAQPVVWLGLPNEIKGPTRVILDERTGRNLLIAGQHDDHARALLAGALISLATQHSPEEAEFLVLETPAAASSLSVASVAARLPHRTQILKPVEVQEKLKQLVGEIDKREGGERGQRIFLIIQNLTAFKVLRPEDEFSISLDSSTSSPAADFQRVYTDGPAHGIHVIAHVDGFSNANRFLGRKGLKEFSGRVLFQMSASDSAAFSDDPRAGNLGLSRAMLYDEQEGTYELFRPYSRPNAGWLAEVEEKLRGRYGLGGDTLDHRDVASPEMLPGESR